MQKFPYIFPLNQGFHLHIGHGTRLIVQMLLFLQKIWLLEVWLNQILDSGSGIPIVLPCFALILVCAHIIANISPQLQVKLSLKAELALISVISFWLSYSYININGEQICHPSLNFIQMNSTIYNLFSMEPGINKQ